MPGENQEFITESKFYVPFSYNKVLGYGVPDDQNQAHMSNELDHKFFDQHFE